MPLPASTAGQFLTLDEISCNGFITKPMARGLVYLTDDGQNARRYHSLSGDPDPTTPSGMVSWSEPLEYKIAGGTPRTINVNFATDGAARIDLLCTIVGTLSSQ